MPTTLSETRDAPPHHAVPRAPCVAIVGATGAVGLELRRCLATRGFPLRGLKLLASARSVGTTLDFNGDRIVVEELTDDSSRN